jgi:hypothetical protein
VPRPILILAIALGVLLAVGVAGIGLAGQVIEQQQQGAAQATRAAEQAQRTGPLALPSVPALKAETPECAKVLAGLPPQLVVDGARVPRRPLTQPAPAGAIAWGDSGHDPVIVHCGIGAPAELTPTSSLIDISGVSWLQLSEGDTTTWVAVDRPVYVALTTPANAGSGPVQDLSAVLGSAFAPRSVFPLPP